ncbi:MAG TPA: NAD(P)-dependent alcohol dehydrogenase [Ktedonobacteraceae bacterium]|nr:NAD(P)-dependent alcohol dehydrogenase [Ktedonobacteraceae bacterium]
MTQTDSKTPQADQFHVASGDTMKAIVYTHYGSPEVLQFKEVAKPTPRDNEVLVHVHAASVNAADLHFLRADPFLMRLWSGLLKPKHHILGAAIAGRVEAVGRNVTQIQPGDEVFGDLSECGLGGFAEYVCASEEALALKPAHVTFEQAAAVPLAAVTALQGLQSKGHIQAGQKVLIHGASGGVGTFAVQIAKAFGAEVTAVCSTRNVDAIRSMGADHVIDYTQEDFTHNGQQYDLIVAANGNRSISEYKRALRPNGTYVMTGGSNKQVFQAMLLGPWISRTGTKKMGNLMAKPNTEDLRFVKELLEAGRVIPVIESCYPLRETAEALRYLEAGHARGKVVITVDQNNNTSR